MSNKKIIVEIICLLYILLFVYASVSKILDFQNFQVQLGQSPLLSAFAGFVSYSVLIVELGIAVLLAIPATRFKALHGAVSLMTMFTTYIIIILKFSSFVPCSCGGILEKLSWKEHFIFNLAFVFIGIYAIIILSTAKRVLFRLLILIVLSISFVVLLFLCSEDIMEKENPFVRRFPQGSAAKVADLDLQNTTYYIAGTFDNKLYLGNYRAPLQVLEISTDLKSKKRYTIELDRENFPFRAVEIRIEYPNFYVIDGTVPVIYRGKIADWKAEVISDKQFSFSNIIFMSPDTFAFRGQERNSGEYILASISNNDKSQIKYNPSALQRQIDGIFDTDGMLQYSHELKKLIYVYYYRNQFIVMDKNLNVEQRGNTIDTTTKAKIKVVKIKSSGDSKLAAPPYLVNKNSSIYGNLLFVNSTLRGKYENPEVWKNATVVDVYDIEKKIYLLSFYVYDEQGLKLKSLFATSEAVFVISGHYLLKYQFGERIKQKINKKNYRPVTGKEIENL